MKNYAGSVGRIAPISRQSIVLVCVSVFVAVCILASALLQHFGFPLDDSWIHQTIGRNFANFGSLGYSPHQRSSGSTSLLWTLLLGTNYKILPHVNPVIYCLAVNSACLLAICLSMLRLAIRDGMTRGLAVLWAVAPLADGNFVWLGFTGMEHLLFVALSLLSISAWFLRGEHPVRTAALAGLALGLLGMTRPEGCVLLVVIFLLEFLTPLRAGRKPRELWTAAALALPLAAIPFAVNLRTSGSLLPLTLKGRQFLYFGTSHIDLSTRLHLLLEWQQRIITSVYMQPADVWAWKPRLIMILLTKIVPLLCLLGLVSLFKDRCSLTLIFCMWGIIHSFLYVIMLPSMGHGGRYQPFILLLLLPLATRGIYFAISIVRLGRSPATWLAYGCLIVFATFSLRMWRLGLSYGIQHIETSHGVMAPYLNAHFPQETIAIFDIGRIGYVFTGTVVDLGGLTDTSYSAYLFRRQVATYLQEHKIEYAVLPRDAGINSRLGLISGQEVDLEPIAHACADFYEWNFTKTLTNNAAQCQDLMRIHYR
jgi:hypothetical protein